ncbi:hypothetical protein G7K_2159-t1 [Saitoella complicata NRRL Y-17804]|uniref:Ubiquitin-like domain-containing protein n=1 Tax=Saitoella complicata (strain BCRC 22490 / CBS 7301 / JCM 7358 / NBRC 10748 / NRRL Y-17804) TaxID=698492 RepID=A0A0E9NE42_SAICN|nr:hypothetical protein G7K_2159-t1 [Saitoella complicata NRRL Y-17804]
MATLTDRLDGLRLDFDTRRRLEQRLDAAEERIEELGETVEKLEEALVSERTALMEVVEENAKLRNALRLRRGNADISAPASDGEEHALRRLEDQISLQKRQYESLCSTYKIKYQDAVDTARRERTQATVRMAHLQLRCEKLEQMLSEGLKEVIEERCKRKESERRCRQLETTVKREVEALRTQIKKDEDGGESQKEFEKLRLANETLHKETSELQIRSEQEMARLREENEISDLGIRLKKLERHALKYAPLEGAHVHDLFEGIERAKTRLGHADEAMRQESRLSAGKETRHATKKERKASEDVIGAAKGSRGSERAQSRASVQTLHQTNNSPPPPRSHPTMPGPFGGTSNAQYIPLQTFNLSRGSAPAPPSQVHLTIRFAGTIPQPPDLNVELVPSAVIKTVKQKIREQRPEFGRRRLRLIHSGRVLRDSGSLQTELRLRSTVEEEDDEVQRGAVVHCSVGDEATHEELEAEARPVTADGEESETPTGPSTLPLPTGFDRLRNAGFSDADIANLRAQFHRLQGGGVGDGEDEDNEAAQARAREMEERWMDEGANTTAGDAATATAELGEGMYWDMFKGLMIGFFAGVFAIFLLREGVFNRRTQIAIIAGLLVNVSFGFLRLA